MTDGPLSVRCPYCLQEPGQPCIRLPKPTDIHQSRRARWLWDRHETTG